MESRQQKLWIAMQISSAQSRAARALIDWTQQQLADASKLNISTIVDFERTRRTVSDDAREAITKALQDAGVVFVPENGEGLGVRLRKRR